MKLKRLLKHYFIPHKGNAYRPHALRHKILSAYSLLMILSQFVFGATIYAGPVSVDAEVLSSNIIAYTNQEREANKLASLYKSELLTQTAELKLKDMFEKNYWDHTGPNGETAWDFMETNNYRYLLAGENLARGYTGSQEVVRAWMNSPTHRSNILNPRFKEIGIAAGTGKIKGQTTTVIVQLFGEPKIAVAGQTNTSLEGDKKIMPEFSPDMATTPSKSPYFIAWTVIFMLVLIDGIMIRKLGLHTSKKHILNLRTSLLMSFIALLVMMFGFVAIA